ncbi:hypothetical protein N7474_001783 [Penicillium riverlandense]|uniref:uncharacterized protein n=1 Tax=Penicillium riverlandense TaxID=1903569 RepID=UPI0025486D02|nr:uncharacterized protein N7474_001783 [Penicillium riverlandense]KAJ5833472.1 hypothetical protein N7474_001783 [Penicillium riverlandense]
MRLLYLPVLLAGATTALAAQRPSHTVVKRELEAYEERYILGQNYQYHNQSVKLIGYQTIKIPVEDIDLFEKHYYTNAYALQEDFPSHFYDSYAAELRIYFPVASALLDHNGLMVEANHLGEFEHDALDGDYAILGRKQTSHVRGVANNIIQDGTIFLAKRNHPVRQIDNTRVYDFGRRSLDHHHAHSPVKKRQYGSAAPEPTAGSGGESNPNNDDNGENPFAKNNGCAANHGGRKGSGGEESLVPEQTDGSSEDVQMSRLGAMSVKATEDVMVARTCSGDGRSGGGIGSEAFGNGLGEASLEFGAQSSWRGHLFASNRAR